MSKSNKSSDTLKKEDVLQAVLIADNFNEIFDDVFSNSSSVLLPLVNTSILDYALECLGQSGIQETILFCCSNAEIIKQHVRSCKWSLPGSTMSISIIISERCLSLGDALRDLDNKALVKGNFILLSAYTVSNLNILQALDYHRLQLKKDKGTAMTLVVQDKGARQNRINETFIALDGKSDRLLLYSKSDSRTKKIDIPVEYFIDYSKLTLHSTLVDTGIAICSPVVPLLFSDNFDFQTKEDFIRGLLQNEEILNSRIYCYKTEFYGATITDWPSYQLVSMDIIHRWAFPMVPDQPINLDTRYMHLRNCFYKQTEVQLLKGCDVVMDVVVGGKTKVGTSKLSRCVIGKGCVIGNNCFIEDCFVFDGAQIEDNSTIRLSVIGSNTRIGSGSFLKTCIVKQNVILSSKSDHREVILSSSSHGGAYEKVGPKAFIVKNCSDDDSDEEEENGFNWLLDLNETIEDEEDNVSGSEADLSYPASVDQDDTSLFYSEVLDSLQRGFEEKLNCKNLVLEINSSRYAYNVTLSEVNQLTVKAILALPLRCKTNVKSLLIYFLPLFENYIKNDAAMVDCLTAFELMAEELGSDILSSLHFLYDKEILNEDNLVSWFNKLDSEELKSKVTPLINWFAEASEEESD